MKDQLDRFLDHFDYIRPTDSAGAQPQSRPGTSCHGDCVLHIFDHVRRLHGTR